MTGYCMICGKPFTMHTFNHKTCSPECAKKRMHENQKRYYCNHTEEMLEYRRRYYREKRAVHNIIPPRACVYCGKEYTPKRNNQKYCCYDCKVKAQYEKQKEYLKLYYASRSNPMYRVGRTEICAHCGKEFTARSWNAVYCCKECKLEHAIDKRRESWKRYSEKKRLAQTNEKARLINNSKRLDDYAAEAQAAGMSYGQYMLMKKLRGEKNETL